MRSVILKINFVDLFGGCVVRGAAIVVVDALTDVLLSCWRDNSVVIFV